MKRWEPLYYGLGAYVILVLAHLALVQGDVWLGDAAYMTLSQEAHRFQVNGELPWFSSRILLGYPILAQGDVGAMYPLSWALYRLDFFWAHGADVLVHYGILILGLQGYLRATGLRRTAAFYGTVMMSLGGLYCGAGLTLPELRPLVWFPFGLWMGVCLIQSAQWWKKGIFGLLLGLVWGLSTVAGDMQVAVYGVVFGVIHHVIWLWRFGKAEAKQGEATGQTKVKPKVSVWVWLVVACVMAYVGSLAQWVFTREWIAQSTLGAVNDSFALSGSFNPFSLVLLWLPVFEPLFTTPGTYLGIMSLFFVFSAVSVRDKEPIIWVHVIFAIVAVVMALGRFSPLYHGFLWVTDLRHFEEPARLIWFAAFSVGYLGAYGFQKVFDEGVIERKFAIRGSNLFFWVSGTVLVITLAVFVMVRLGREVLTDFLVAIAQGQGRLESAEELSAYKVSLATWLDKLQDLMSFHHPWFWMGLICVGAGCALVWWVKKRPTKHWAYTGVIALTAVELLIYQGWWQPQRTVRPGLVRSDVGGDASLRIVDLTRVNTGEARVSMHWPDPDVPQVLHEIIYPWGLVPDAYGRYSVHPQNPVESPAREVLDALAITHFSADGPVQAKGVQSVTAKAGLQTQLQANWQNTQAMARWRLVGRFHLAGKQTEQAGEPIDLARTVILDRVPQADTSIGYGETPVVGEKIDLISESGTKISFDVETPADRFFVLADQWYPGWVATIDGLEVPLYRANYTCRAVLVPAGKHRVTFTYYPGLAYAPRWLGWE